MINHQWFAFLQETRRNTLIKDSMRETCIPALVESWYLILQTYQRSHSELTCQCLEVVGAYVSWIDLNLIANDRSELKRLLCLLLHFSLTLCSVRFIKCVMFLILCVCMISDFFPPMFEYILEVAEQSYCIAENAELELLRVYFRQSTI